MFASREEWLQARNNRIGGSDAAAIIGLNPYMSNVELWEIKTGRRQQEDISQKPYVKYGTKAEKYLRELFKLDHPEYLVLYQENNMFFNDAYPWAHASLDGWLGSENGFHLEAALDQPGAEIWNFISSNTAGNAQQYMSFLRHENEPPSYEGKSIPTHIISLYHIIFFGKYKKKRRN